MPKKKRGRDLSRLSKNAKNARKNRAKRTPEEIQREQDKARMAMMALRASLTPEQRAERNEQKRIQMQKNRRLKSYKMREKKRIRSQNRQVLISTFLCHANNEGISEVRSYQTQVARAERYQKRLLRANEGHSQQDQAIKSRTNIENNMKESSKEQKTKTHRPERPKMPEARAKKRLLKSSLPSNLNTLIAKEPQSEQVYPSAFEQATTTQNVRKEQIRHNNDSSLNLIISYQQLESDKAHSNKVNSIEETTGEQIHMGKKNVYLDISELGPAHSQEAQGEQNKQQQMEHVKSNEVRKDEQIQTEKQNVCLDMSELGADHSQEAQSEQNKQQQMEQARPSNVNSNEERTEEQIQTEKKKACLDSSALRPENIQQWQGEQNKQQQLPKAHSPNFNNFTVHDRQQRDVDRELIVTTVNDQQGEQEIQPLAYDLVLRPADVNATTISNTEEECTDELLIHETHKTHVSTSQTGQMLQLQMKGLHPFELNAARVNESQCPQVYRELHSNSGPRKLIASKIDSKESAEEEIESNEKKTCLDFSERRLSHSQKAQDDQNKQQQLEQVVQFNSIQFTVNERQHQDVHHQLTTVSSLQQYLNMIDRTHIPLSVSVHRHPLEEGTAIGDSDDIVERAYMERTHMVDKSPTSTLTSVRHSSLKCQQKGDIYEKPKLPPSAYKIWVRSNSVREKIKQENPNLNSIQIAVMAEQVWSALIDKSKWEAKEHYRRKKYEEACRLYASNVQQPSGSLKEISMSELRTSHSQKAQGEQKKQQQLEQARPSNVNSSEERKEEQIQTEKHNAYLGMLELRPSHSQKAQGKQNKQQQLEQARPPKVNSSEERKEEQLQTEKHIACLGMLELCTAHSQEAQGDQNKQQQLEQAGQSNLIQFTFNERQHQDVHHHLTTASSHQQHLNMIDKTKIPLSASVHRPALEEESAINLDDIVERAHMERSHIGDKSTAFPSTSVRRSSLNCTQKGDIYEKPKLPPSTFKNWLRSNSVHEKIKLENPNLNSIQIAVMAEQIWSALIDKSKWEAKEHYHRKKYEEACRQYAANVQQPSGSLKESSMSELRPSHAQMAQGEQSKQQQLEQAGQSNFIQFTVNERQHQDVHHHLTTASSHQQHLHMIDKTKIPLSASVHHPALVEESAIDDTDDIVERAHKERTHMGDKSPTSPFTSDLRSSLKCKRKDDIYEKPKLPPSAYKIWLRSNSVREKIKQENPNLNYIQIAVMAEQMWSALIDKSKWETKEHYRRKKYEEACWEYAANVQQPSGSLKESSMSELRPSHLQKAQCEQNKQQQLEQARPSNVNSSEERKEEQVQTEMHNACLGMLELGTTHSREAQGEQNKQQQLEQESSPNFINFPVHYREHRARLYLSKCQPSHSQKTQNEQNKQGQWEQTSQFNFIQLPVNERQHQDVHHHLSTASSHQQYLNIIDKTKIPLSVSVHRPLLEEESAINLDDIIECTHMEHTHMVDKLTTSPSTSVRRSSLKCQQKGDIYVKPKLPASAYKIWLRSNSVREKIKQENPNLNSIQIAVIAEQMWSALIDKSKWEAKEHYHRKKYEEACRQYAANLQQLSGSSNESSKSELRPSHSQKAQGVQNKQQQLEQACPSNVNSKEERKVEQIQTEKHNACLGMLELGTAHSQEPQGEQNKQQQLEQWDQSNFIQFTVSERQHQDVHHQLATASSHQQHLNMIDKTKIPLSVSVHRLPLEEESAIDDSDNIVEPARMERIHMFDKSTTSPSTSVRRSSLKCQQKGDIYEKPKLPASAYKIWLRSNSVRKKIKQENPNLNSIQIAVKAEQIWSALIDKSKWEAKEHYRRKKYEEACREYAANVQQPSGSVKKSSMSEMRPSHSEKAQGEQNKQQQLEQVRPSNVNSSEERTEEQIQTEMRNACLGMLELDTTHSQESQSGQNKQQQLAQHRDVDRALTLTTVNHPQGEQENQILSSDLIFHPAEVNATNTSNTEEERTYELFNQETHKTHGSTSQLGAFQIQTAQTEQMKGLRPFELNAARANESQFPQVVDSIENSAEEEIESNEKKTRLDFSKRQPSHSQKAQAEQNKQGQWEEVGQSTFIQFAVNEPQHQDVHHQLTTTSSYQQYLNMIDKTKIPLSVTVHRPLLEEESAIDDTDDIIERTHMEHTHMVDKSTTSPSTSVRRSSLKCQQKGDIYEKPKLPASAYKIWLRSNSVREKIKQENPNLNSIQIAVKSEQIWSALIDKSKWEAKEHYRRKKYEEACREYAANVQQPSGSVKESSMSEMRPSHSEKEQGEQNKQQQLEQVRPSNVNSNEERTEEQIQTEMRNACLGMLELDTTHSQESQSGQNKQQQLAQHRDVDRALTLTTVNDPQGEQENRILSSDLIFHPAEVNATNTSNTEEERTYELFNQETHKTHGSTSQLGAFQIQTAQTEQMKGLRPFELNAARANESQFPQVVDSIENSAEEEIESNEKKTRLDFSKRQPSHSQKAQAEQNKQGQWEEVGQSTFIQFAVNERQHQDVHHQLTTTSSYQQYLNMIDKTKIPLSVTVHRPLLEEESAIDDTDDIIERTHMERTHMVDKSATSPSTSVRRSSLKCTQKGDIYEKPKLPPSAYKIWLRSNPVREKIKQENPNLNSIQIAVMAEQMWSALVDKSKWEAKEHYRRKKYEEACRQYAANVQLLSGSSVESAKVAKPMPLKRKRSYSDD